jgi:hypothetical protein
MSSSSTIQPNQTSTALVQLLSSTTVDSQSSTPSESAPVKNNHSTGLSLWPVWLILAIVIIFLYIKPLVAYCSDKHKERKAKQTRAAAQAYIDAQRQQTFVYERYP